MLQGFGGRQPWDTTLQRPVPRLTIQMDCSVKFKIMLDLLKANLNFEPEKEIHTGEVSNLRLCAGFLLDVLSDICKRPMRLNSLHLIRYKVSCLLPSL